MSFFTRATADGGMYLLTCLPRAPFDLNLYCGLARRTVPSLSLYGLRLDAIDPSANSSIAATSAWISRMRVSVSFFMSWPSFVSMPTVGIDKLYHNFARPCWLVSGNSHAGQKACANCVEAGGRLSHESTFAGPT